MTPHEIESLTLGLVTPLKPGDVVQMRSTGHEMTIDLIDGDVASCVWAAGGRIYRERLSVHLLRRGKPIPVLIVEELDSAPPERQAD